MKPLKEIIFIAEEDEIDGGYVAKALDYSIITEGETWDELRKNVIDAVKCHFEVNKKVEGGRWKEIKIIH